MNRQKALVLLVTLALMAGTVGALTWLKGRQKLGQPGIISTPISESVMMKVDLPERVLDYDSTNVPESEVELSYFPKDTTYARRLYQAPDGFGASVTVILMGTDRTSIHRPDYCLLGQGWRIDHKAVENIPIAGTSPYDLPVMKWLMTKTVETPDGRRQELRGWYVFWFVADNEQTTDNVQLQYFLVRDLLFNGILQRWAYISYFTVCAPGQEDAAFERMKKFVAASVPAYQLPPAKR
jgi:hypothetical protein